VSDCVRVLIADDHAPTRAALREEIEETGRYVVCAEAADAAGAIAAAVRTRPSLCLLDVRMPGRGTAAAWEITARLPNTRVVMLTVSRDDDDLFAALRAGASAYLLKDVPGGDLASLLDRVLDGEAPIPAALVARMVAQFRGARPGRRRTLTAMDETAALTSREWDVLSLLQDGQTTRQIAEHLSLSTSAVRSHVSAILRKLRVSNRDAAMQLLEAQRER
jgi:DNA-binding NarL/FixJ family response regulator